MKVFSWFILLISYTYLVFSTGKIDVNTLSLAILFTLVSVISELKDFNFWGIKGTRESIEKSKEIVINSQNTDSAITIEKSRKTKKKGELAEVVPIQLMDNDMGNFLTYAFEIERLLRIFGEYLLHDSKSNNMPLRMLAKKLHEIDGLSDQGYKNFEDIQWLRNMLVHGKVSAITRETLQAGIQIAERFYQDLYDWFNPTSGKQ